MWRAVFALASGSGINARLSILIFHRVLPKPDPLFLGEPCAAQFDTLLTHVMKRFRVLPLDHAIQALRSGTLPARALAVTFDDGYANNLTVAAPILKRHGVPATIFVATAYLDGGCMWNDLVIEAFRTTKQCQLDLEWSGLGKLPVTSAENRRRGIDQVLAKLKYLPPSQRRKRAEDVLRAAKVPEPSGLMLTRESVRALSQSGCDIGAHTVTHPILTRVTKDEAWREIIGSKEDLEQVLDKPVSLFAYPNGRPNQDYSIDHVRMVEKAGFSAAVTTASGAAAHGSDPFQLQRFSPWSRAPLKFDCLMLRNLRQVIEPRPI